jgi:hypothetical protein
VQSAVVLTVLAASAAAATLGLTLLTSANEGFPASVAAYGAQLAVTVNASKVTLAGLAATRQLTGVTGAASSSSSPGRAPDGRRAARTPRPGLTPIGTLPDPHPGVRETMGWIRGADPDEIS